VENTPQYDDECIKGKLIEQLCDNYEGDVAVIVGYVQMRTNTMFSSNRDFVFLQVSFALEDGSRAVLRHSIPHPDVPEVGDFIRSEMGTSGYLISPHPTDENASEVVLLSTVDFGAIANHTAGRGFVEAQTQLGSALRAKFSETKDDIKGLTSRTKNLFVEKANLRDDEVNESVINTWLADLVRAAAGGGVDGWQFVKEEQGVTIDSKAFGENSQILCVRGRITIPAVPDKIFSVVSDVNKSTDYDKFFINGRSVRMVTQKGNTAMFVNWAAFQTGAALFSDRDFCFLQVNKQMSQDMFVVLCRSVEDENVPAKDGFVRGDIWTTGFIIQGSPSSLEASSSVTYVCALDLRGMVPKFISNMLLQELPLKLSGIHQFFVSGGVAVGNSTYDGAEDANGKAPDTSRLNFLEGQQMDSGLITPGRPLQEMYVPKSGADKALPKLSFDNLGPSTGGPKKKK